MTDTTISTDPATLRQAAYGIAQSYPAIADILYTIAAEKEAQAAPRVYRPGQRLGGGLVAVPEEPTKEMLHAGTLANRAWFVSPIDKEIAYKETQNSYRAMLAALMKGERS